MNRLQKLFDENQFPLIVSLPKQKVDWAQAAQDNGADAIKVHTSLTHFASGSNFKTLDAEAPVFEQIRKSVSIPMGIVPGRGVDLESSEIQQMADIGFDFFDAFLSAITPRILKEKRLAAMLCVLPYNTIDEARVASEIDEVVCIEADIVSHEGYGKNLSIEDLVRYKQHTSVLAKPLVIPTQRKIWPEEVEFLKRAGARSLMIGAIVTGDILEDFIKATKAFRDAIDEITE